MRVAPAATCWEKEIDKENDDFLLFVWLTLAASAAAISREKTEKADSPRTTGAEARRNMQGIKRQKKS